MALRHALPIKRFPDFRSEAIPAVAPPAMRPPTVVEFRPDTNLSDLVNSMTRYTRVRVSAPAGAGKSTELPKRLAAAAKLPVVLAVPSELLALDHFNYLSGMYPGQFSLASSEEHVVAPTGVTVTTYAWLTGKFVQLKGRQDPLGKFILMADEVHESDAYSDFIRRIGSHLPGVTCFVEMSATHNPAGMQRLELKGSLKTEFYPRENPATWDPDQDDKPWSVSSIDCNTLIVLDDNRAAERMQAKYVRAGFSAYRLHSRMSTRKFEDIMAEMRDPKRGVVVLLADYSFRNGFTFPVSRIVDSGLVRFATVKDGVLSFGYRKMYDSEKYQTMARGGRTEGSQCVYYIPEGLDFESSMSVLEEVEMEASCLLFRVYGYLPPVTHRSVLPADKLPRDVAAALNGVQPLALLSEIDLVSALVEEQKTVTEVAELLESYGMVEESDEVQTADLFAGFVKSEGKVVATAVAGDFLEQLQELSSAAHTLEVGFYYYCAEAVYTGVLKGQEVQDLAALIHANPLVVTGMSSAARKEAVFVLLQEYNRCTLMQAAMSRISAHSEALTSLVKTYPEPVKAWSKWITSMGREQSALAGSYLAAIGAVRTASMNVRRVDPDRELEEKRAKELIAPLLAAVKSASSEIPRGDFFAALENHAGMVTGPEFPRNRAITAKEEEEDGLGGKFSWNVVHVGDTVMHDMKFIPHNPLQWDLQEYVSAVDTMIKKQGVVAESIRRLTIEAPGITGDAVMQAVRDGTSRKQKLVKFVVKTARR